MRTNIKKQIKDINNRLDAIKGNYAIKHTIIFTSDTNFELVYDLYRNKKLIKTFKYTLSDLQNKDTDNDYLGKLQKQYNIPIDAEYDSLNEKQLNYIIDVMEGILDAK